VYTHILISTDGSELAQRGVDHGLSLAKALGSKVTIVTVTEPIPTAGIAGYGGWVTTDLDIEGLEAVNNELANGILSNAKSLAERMELEVKTVHIRNAWPANAIVDAAQEHGCNLIVMASHGRRGIKKILLGSQTSEVLVNAPVPVLVVH
jgi:nucleotide-binding universal stress UspA family protein